MRSGKAAFYTLFFIFISSISFIGNEVERHYSIILLLSYFAAFFSYFWICRFEWDNLKALIFLFLGTRLILMFALPELSDDFYRFIWDGKLINAGINPYLQIPQNVDFHSVPGLSSDLYEKLNSPQYFSIYPPLNQVIFSLSTYLDVNWLTSVNIIRSLLILADIGTFILIRKLLSPEKKHMSFWYVLNPLVIIEFTGNLHFEGFVIFFLILTLYFLKDRRWLFSGISLGLSIATKLLPLIFLPFLTWNNRWKGGLILGTMALLISGLTFIPLFSEALRNGMGRSLELYFNHFEFNASIYYLFREVGYWQKGYNIIGTLGPDLARMSALFIVVLAIWGSYRNRNTAEILLFSLVVYLALATTVHPWYIIPLIPLGILSGYYFPIIWSFFVFVTYVGYSEQGYELPMFWILIEYAVVYSVMIFEVYKRNEKGPYLV